MHEYNTEAEFDAVLVFVSFVFFFLLVLVSVLLFQEVARVHMLQKCST